MTACPTVKVSQHTSFALLRFVCRFHFAREEKRNNKKNPYFLTFPNTEKRKHWDGPFILCCLSNNRGSSDNHAAHSQPKMHFLAFPDTLSPYQQPEKIPRHLQRNLFLCNAHFSRFETTNLKISLAGTPLNPTTRSLFTAPAPAPLKKTNNVDSFRLVYAGKCTITSKTNRIEVCFPWKYIFKRFGIHSRLATQALTIIFSSLEMKHFCFIVQFNTAMANKTISAAICCWRKECYLTFQILFLWIPVSDWFACDRAWEDWEEKNTRRTVQICLYQDPKKKT